jgi:hypothetical protein
LAGHRMGLCHSDSQGIPGLRAVGESGSWIGISTSPSLRQITQTPEKSGVFAF